MRVHTRAVLKKFEGEIPEAHADDPEAHGHKLLETVVMEDGKPTEVITEDS